MRTNQNRLSLWARLAVRESAPSWLLSSGLGFVSAYVVFTMLLLFSVSILTGEVDGRLPTPATLAISAILACVVTTIGVYQWARQRFGADWQSALRVALPKRAAALLAIFLFGLGMAGLLDLLGRVTRLTGGQIVPPILSGLRSTDAATFIFALMLAVVFQPIAEGLIYQGVLYPVLSKQTGDNRIAMLILALLALVVSLIISASPGGWYALIQPFFMALIVSGVRAYTQSARAAIVVRMAFGVFFVLIALFSGGFSRVPNPFEG